MYTGGFSEQIAASYFKQLLSALDAAHLLGISRAMRLKRMEEAGSAPVKPLHNSSRNTDNDSQLQGH